MTKNVEISTKIVYHTIFADVLFEVKREITFKMNFLLQCIKD